MPDTPPRMTPCGCRVIPIRLWISNVFLVQGERTVIVDTGMPGGARRIVRQMVRHGISPHEVSLILLTHGHVDHMGSAADLKDHTGAPVAIHERDAAALRSGRNPPLKPLGAAARLLKPLFQHNHCRPCEPDLLFGEPTRLDVFGIPGRLLATPGHTHGSLSLLLDSGELIAGDLLRGGYLGGYVGKGRPRLPYFLDDLALTHRSLAAIGQLPLSRVHVGHGGPLEPAAIRREFQA